MQQGVHRIHVTGGPGSGKTRFAQRVAASRSAPMHDLDALLLAAGDDLNSLVDDTVASPTEWPEWVSEGVYFGWALPFLECADMVVWLDVPWRVASYRIISRHLRLELTRKNRFPGWARLYSFWRWSARYYADRNEASLNRFGAPNTRAATARELARYRSKLVTCRSSSEVADLLTGVETAPRTGVELHRREGE